MTGAATAMLTRSTYEMKHIAQRTKRIRWRTFVRIRRQRITRLPSPPSRDRCADDGEVHARHRRRVVDAHFRPHGKGGRDRDVETRAAANRQPEIAVRHFGHRADS